LNRRPGASNPTPADITPFYAPSTFTIYGSVYNQTLRIPGEEVVLNNVTMSVTLPRGCGLP
jgi:hypothetical protein